uniref:OB-fold domain-containing protein n=1 Tax=Klebsiella pneumoniae TaxID=573 RepID=UPI0025A16034
MYNYIFGKIVDIEGNFVVVDCNSIGYQINVANPFSFEMDKEYKIYLYEQITEDSHSLFGFK